MTDMAPMEDVEDAWEELQDILDNSGSIIPGTYKYSGWPCKIATKWPFA